MYEHRFGSFFLQPIIAGLKKNGDPYLCGMDSIGAASSTAPFYVAGTTSDMLFGVCEQNWKPDLEPEELFEVVSQVRRCSRNTAVFEK